MPTQTSEIAAIRKLQQAASAGRVDECRELVESGVPVDGTVEHMPLTALQFASGSGRLDVVKLLIFLGARIDGGVDSSSTPLHHAAMGGHLAVVRELVEVGADIHRESLRLPLTPTGTAEYWSFQNQGQREVAEYLRTLGGINPYNGERPDDVWEGLGGEMHIELVERALNGRVSPVPFARATITGREVAIRTSRFAPTLFLFRTLFTTSLSPIAGQELALVLPSLWPLHARALQEPRYAWPLDLLAHLEERASRGASLAHGDVLNRGDEHLAGLDWPTNFDQWLVVCHGSLEERRLAVPEAMLSPTLFLVPHANKKPIVPGKDALTRADAKATVKWARPALGQGKNGLVVPLADGSHSAVGT